MEIINALWLAFKFLLLTTGCLFLLILIVAIIKQPFEEVKRKKKAEETIKRILEDIDKKDKK